MPPLQRAIVAITGGLQDSKSFPEATDLQNLSNFGLFRGRFAIRAPLTETVQLKSLTADESPSQPVDQVLAITFHDDNMYVAAWRGGAINKTYLYKLKTNGTPIGGGSTEEPVGTIWSGATLPRPVMVSFSGGSATSPVKRLYIADYNVVTTDNATRFWNGSTIADVTEDLDDDGSKEALKFNYIFTYQHHVWGAGFWNDSPAVFRPEVLRFTQPGAIPADEPFVTNNIAREWWSTDFRPVGVRGYGIVGVGFAGGGAIILKRTECFALFGYGSDSWTLRPLSNRVGLLGPHAVCSTDDGLCFFWSDQGPYVTDGQSPPQAIGEPIMKRVREVTPSDAVCAEYSPDDGIVYFAVTGTGGTSPDRYFAYDKVRNLWAEGSWLATGGSTLLMNDLTAVPDATLPGPAGAPSSAAATSTSDSTVTVTWVNGDTAIGTTTELEVSINGGGFVNVTSIIGAGVTSYNHTGLSARTDHAYRLRHKRNGQTSSYSSTSNTARTWVKEPTGLDAMSLSNGVKVVMTQADSVNVDVMIERSIDGSDWVALTTLTNQTPGPLTHNDTTGTCGVLYYYRAKSAKGGETTSEYSNTDSFQACNAACALTSATLVFTPDSPPPKCYHGMTVNWTATNISGADTAKIYRKVDAGAYTLRGTVSLGALTFSEEYAQLNPTGSQVLQYKVEAWDEGTTLQNSIETATEDVSCPP